MTVIELLDGLISDVKDYIAEYKADIQLTDSRVEKYEKKVRIDELQGWKKTLEIIRSEQD